MAAKVKTGIVLMYNCSGPEYSKLRQIFAMLRLRMHPISADRYHVALKELAAGAGEAVAPEEAPKAFDEKMLVFCYLAKPLLHQVLEVIRLSELPPIELKAVLTETNQEWDSTHLHDELIQERDAILDAAKAEADKKAAEAEKAEEPQT